MKKLIQYSGLFLCLANLNLQLSTAFAQGTAFTYQGRLNSGGAPANGSYDLQFSLYNVSTNGVIFAGPLTNSATGVSNGLFTVTLDFGPGVFTGPGYWLDISVRTNGGGTFTELAPRQALLPTPYAIMANSASNLLGTLPAAQLTGQIPAGQLNGPIASSNISGTYSQPVTFNNGQDEFDGSFFGSFFGSTFQGGTFTGQFVGDGSGLVNINPAHIGSGQIAFLNSNQVFTAQNVFMQPVGFGQPNPSPFWQIDVLGGEANLRQISTNSGGGSTLELRSLYNAPNEALGAINFNNAGNNYPGQIDYIQANPANSNFDYMQFRVGGSTAFTIQADVRGAYAANITGGFPGNSISTFADGSDVIAGGGFSGLPNTISTNTDGAFIGAGSGNQVGPNVLDGVIAGGYQNSLQSWRAVIGGGEVNLILGLPADHAVIAGGYQNTVEASQAAIGGGYGNLIALSSDHAVIAGGDGNQIGQSSDHAVIAGGDHNSIAFETSHAFVGAGYGNSVGFYSGFSAIGSGINNTIETNAGNSLIGAGNNNDIQANSYNSVIGGGSGNFIQPFSDHGAIAGGNGNIIGSNAYDAAILGGDGNIVLPYDSFSSIGGGNLNTNGSSYCFIGGGYNNLIQAYASVIGGGSGNTIQLIADHSTIAGGYNNQIQTNAWDSAIGGGYGNVIGPFAEFATIGGGNVNTDDGLYSVIAGGYNNLIQSGTVDFIGGGRNNQIGTNSTANTIVGSYNNIGPTTAYSSIDGGLNNFIGSYVGESTIAGGNVNVILGDENLYTNGYAYGSTIGGGYQNVILTNSASATIAGGLFNGVGPGATWATVGGGVNNTNGGSYSTIAGGASNIILTNAGGATIGGGYNNVVASTNGTVPGGYGNLAGGVGSFAAGTQAQATNNGAFVLADNEPTNFYSTSSNQLSARFVGGIRFVTAGAGMTLDGQSILSGSVNPGQLSGVYTNAVTMTNGANIFAGNGTGLTNVNAALLNGLPSSAFAPASGSTNYIQNQILGIQNASFQISGSALIGGAVTASNLIAYNATVSATLTTSNLQINGGEFQVLGAGSNTLTTAFIQWSTAGNISGDHTIINNPLCNGDPNAILIVTHNYNPGSSGSQTVWNHVLGTFYTGGQWTIYNEDQSAMVANVAFNVLVIKH